MTDIFALNGDVTKAAFQIQNFFIKLGISKKTRYLVRDYRKNGANDLIRDLLTKDEPCMICRFGLTEIETIIRNLYVNFQEPLPFKAWQFIRGNYEPFWWDKSLLFRLSNNAGFFPINKQSIEEFSSLMLSCVKNTDVLTTWCRQEHRLEDFYSQAQKIDFLGLEPFFYENPWSETLEGKKVLVIHPFESTILHQYQKRALLFKDLKVLPQFDLITLKAVQSAAGNKVEFSSWFNALDYMCKKIDDLKFDIAIVGAGAYGLPLASYIKSLGKKAVHLGGATQLLFGIKGKRWDDKKNYRQFYNEHWIRPFQEDTPRLADRVEGGCYW